LSSSPLAAVTTGRAPAAIGVIEVSGPGALAAAGACFSRVGGVCPPTSEPFSPAADNPDLPAAPFPPGTTTLGTLHDGGSPLDEALLVYLPPSQSWTGEELVELHCHGGPVLLDAVLEALERRGVRRGTLADLAARAVRNDRMDPVQAEALEALAPARTPLAAWVYLDQWNGRLSRDLRDLLDSPPDRFAEKLDSLLVTASFGLALSHPPRVVLAGPPNAGKSTLFNALVGADRSIVHETPGTTRDPVDALIAPDGIPIRLVDTAGVGDAGGVGPASVPIDSILGFGGAGPTTCEPPGGRGLSAEARAVPRDGGQPRSCAPSLPANRGCPPPTGTTPPCGGQTPPTDNPAPLAAAAQAAALRALASADAVLWVVDATRPVPDAFAPLAAGTQGPSAWILNKIDLLPNDDPALPLPLERPGQAPVLRVSARTGRGIPELAATLPALAGLVSVPPPGAPCVFTARQRDALKTARLALPDLARARQAVSTLLAP